VISTHVLASPADYIFTPNVEFGEHEIDIKSGQSDSLLGTQAKANSIGFGLGARENWFTELYLKQDSNGNSTLAEWENKFQLTETGRYPVDLGLVTELEIPIHGQAPKEFSFGPLLQAELGKYQFNGNVLFEKAFGQLDENGLPFNPVLNYQWQAKYRLRSEFEFGVQRFSSLGKWDNWGQRNAQISNLGPAVFGKIKLNNLHNIKYNAAWLFGNNNHTPNHTFRTQIEYEY
jgi:hypothetical protein